LGSKFWALGGLNQKSKKQFRGGGHGEPTAKKWLNCIEKQKKKKQLEVCDKQTDRQSQLLTIMTRRLGAEINNKSSHSSCEAVLLCFVQWLERAVKEIVSSDEDRWSFCAVLCPATSVV